VYTAGGNDLAQEKTMELRESNTGITCGLSEKEAASILHEEGYNEIPSANRSSVLGIALGVVREPMFIMLVATGLVYIALGDLQEALILLSFVFVIMGITFYQERKTERALEALRDLSSPRALVIRGGERKRIAGRDVVRDDILVLAEGDRVPADSVLLDATNLSADESLLTGESVPVRKVACDGLREMGQPGGDDLPFVYSGSLIVQGHGIAQVRTTGVHTEMGKIGKALTAVETERTPLQQETQRIVLRVASLGLFLCALVIIVYGITRGSWLDGILAGITLAMAILPEEFPVVLTIFLALGAWRISQKGVLTRRVPVVETLGSATVLCVDKTGTLTMNQMSVSKIFADGKFHDIGSDAEYLPEDFHELVEFSILASQRDPFDPMEKAIRQLGDSYLVQTEHLHQNWVLVREYPLSKDLLALSHVWRSPGGDEFVIAAKGAPEAIADLCHLGKSQMNQLSESVSAMADDGLRVLGVARAAFKQKDLPGVQHDFQFEFLGFLGLADPIRPAVPAAIKECYAAGIRVVMITGDYPGTARSIARQIGLTPMDEYITGPELNEMDDLELQKRIRTVNIFARVVPEQKLRLVNALKTNGEIVAMTGDGVNDAPALKSASIGIAMGGRGTDVAREASALVLLDDDFSSIVQAVRMGRRIFDNLRKAMAYIFAIHVPIAGLSLIPVFLGWPLILMPVHIVFLELIIDPACSVVFEAEPEESNVMKRRPRSANEPVFSRRTVWLSLLQGTSILVIVVAVFGISLYRGQSELDARTLTFTTLILANLGLILTNRSWSQPIIATLRHPNSAQWWVVSGALVFLGMILLVPSLRDLFRFNQLHPIDLIISFSAALLSVLWFEIFKVIRKTRKLAL
jgi:P-type Ca2+ transporter type 2C